jgi:hypothetical protein
MSALVDDRTELVYLIRTPIVFDQECTSNSEEECITKTDRIALVDLIRTSLLESDQNCTIRPESTESGDDRTALGYTTAQSDLIRSALVYLIRTAPVDEWIELLDLIRTPLVDLIRTELVKSDQE